MNATERQNEARIDRLNAEKRLPHEEWTALLSTWDDSDRAYYAVPAVRSDAARSVFRLKVKVLFDVRGCCVAI